MATILVAHAPAAKKRALRVTATLQALGFTVELSDAQALAPHPRRRLDAAVARAGRVLVLWSKDATAAQGVMAAASRAKAAGKLSLARLDAATPPILLRSPAIGDLSAWSGRAEARSFRRLLADLPRAKSRPSAPALQAAAPPPAPGRGGGWIVGVVLALVAAMGTGVYFLLF